MGRVIDRTATARGPADDHPPPETPRRRRLAVSLRAVMLAVLVVGGWAGWVANRASAQRRAVATIRVAKGSIK